MLHDANARILRKGAGSEKRQKTYNSGYSPVVTHLTTNPPVSCLSTAERTGRAGFRILWSYVKDRGQADVYIDVTCVANVCLRGPLPPWLAKVVSRNHDFTRRSNGKSKMVKGGFESKTCSGWVSGTVSSMHIRIRAHYLW